MDDAAAIAPKRAAAQYGGRVLLAGIEDDQQNYTRFLLINKSRKITHGANKTSIGFALKNEPGALFKALSVFALRDISLSKIESRPLRGHPWEYVFFVDMLRGDDEPARNALRHLGEIAEFVKVLGSIPRQRCGRRPSALLRDSLTISFERARPHRLPPNSDYVCLVSGHEFTRADKLWLCD